MIFEKEWLCEGNAFEGFINGCADSTNPNANCNFGKITSPEFTINSKYMIFEFRCTSWDSKTGMKFYVDDDLQFILTDCIIQEPMKQYAFDLSDFIGSKGKIVLSDQGSHEAVVLKNIVFTDELIKNPRLLKPIKDCCMLDLSIEIGENKFLNIPIEKGACAEFCNFSFDDKLEFNMNLKLAKNDTVDIISSIPVEEYKNKKVRIFSNEIFIPKEDYEAFCKRVTVSKEPCGFENFYKEYGRPKLHFTTPYGGNGDMIGFHYYKGKYHIGYLFDSAYNTWNDNASWAFSESEDLLFWQNQKMIVRKGFENKRSSGCGFIDNLNASNLKSGEETPILLFYGKENQLGQRYQNFTNDPLAEERKDMLTAISVKYSTDGGNTFKEYEQNPLFFSKSIGGHDPEVFYYEPQDKYVMVLHDKDKGIWGFDFYESKNLLEWSYMSRIEGLWETPNMYELPLDGDESNKYWVLQQCNFDYIVGDFDGQRFIPKTERQKVYDNAFAMRTFYDEKLKRRIQMGAMFNTYQGNGNYNGYGGGTIPSEIELKSTPKGMKIAYKPVRELEKLILKQHSFENIESQVFNQLRLCGGLLDIEIESKESFCLNIGNIKIFAYDKETNSYQIGNVNGRIDNSNCIVRLFIDEYVTSYYIDNGLIAGNTYFSDYHINEDDSISFSESKILDNVKIKYLRSPFTI